MVDMSVVDELPQPVYALSHSTRVTWWAWQQRHTETHDVIDSTALPTSGCVLSRPCSQLRQSLPV